jgi:hypothetical protein
MPRGRTKKAEVQSTSEHPGVAPAIPLPAVLSFLKDTRGVTTWTTREMSDCLGINVNEAQHILPVMEMQGYVKSAEGTREWLTTPAGETVSRSRPPRFNPQAVKDALSALRDRIRETNRDRQSPFNVVDAVAFGDFLSGRSRVQAADVGVRLRRRGVDSASPAEERAARQTFLRRLRGRSAALHLRVYEEWMRKRRHRELM